MVTWSSSNTSRATVDPTTGAVTGVSPGAVDIIATAQDGSGVVGRRSITVSAAKTDVTVTGTQGTLTNQTPLVLFVGLTTTVSVSVQPNNATNQNFTWSTNPNSSIATRNGNTFRGVSEGITNATVSTTDGNRQASFRIVVATRLPQPRTRGIRNAQYMHAGPGTTFDRVAWLSANQQVVVYAVLGNYYLVVDGPRAGFVPRASVVEITGSTRQVSLRNYTNRPLGTFSANAPNGFAVGTRFAYSFEIIHGLFNSYQGHHLYRYDIVARSLVRMTGQNIHPNGLGHANDIALVEIPGGNTYMFVTVFQSGNSNFNNAIVQLRINNNNNTYEEVARFITSYLPPNPPANHNPNRVISGISVISRSGGNLQLLLRGTAGTGGANARFFRGTIRYNNHTSGTINLVPAFRIYEGGHPLPDGWSRQGMHLEGSRLYHSLSSSGATSNQSVILVYNAAPLIGLNNSTTLSPHNGDPWRFIGPTGSTFEVEAFGIRNGEMWFLRDTGTRANAGIYTAVRRP